MPFGFVTSTGNSFLNPTAASTWTPEFSFWGVDFDPSNQASWLAFADYASAALRNTFQFGSRITPQGVAGAAARQIAVTGSRGVDLYGVSRSLARIPPRIIPSGQLFSRAAAPLYFAQTLGGSTPSPIQTKQMLDKPFTPAPVTTFLENLFGVNTQQSQQVQPTRTGSAQYAASERIQIKNKPKSKGPQGGSGARRV